MYTPDNLDTLFSLFLTIQASDTSQHLKRSMVSCLLGDGAGERGWRVVGITEDALLKLAENDYCYTKGIQRCHKHQRQARLDEMIATSFDTALEWWSSYYDNDSTILGTSTENMSDNWSTVYYFNDDNSYTGFFPSARIGYRHNKKDTAFISQFASEIV